MFAGEEERQNFSSKHQRENDACFQNLTSFFHPPLAVDAREAAGGRVGRRLAVWQAGGNVKKEERGNMVRGESIKKFRAR
jgi:hypothetical protein